jgi:hypothetical protein
LGKWRGSRPGLLETVAVLFVAATAPAGAADADTCCADLEQRVAELDVLTARKGNRAVSVEISGTINHAVLGWDDGVERKAYVVTNDNDRSRFRFVGKAAVSPDLEFGYRIEIGIKAANSIRVNQLSSQGFDNRPNVGLDMRDSIWFAKSKTFGMFIVGTTFAATDRIADSNLTQTSTFAKYAEVQDTGLGMFLRSSRNGELTVSDLTWRRIIGAGGDQPGESQRGFELIKYVTPTWNGFTGVATLVADDFWDSALRYKNELGRFELAAGIGVLQLLPGSKSRQVCAGANFVTNSGDETACRQASGSVSVLDRPTGLFFNLGAGLTIDGLIFATQRYAGTGVDDSQVFWATQAGIERRINDLGKTTLYAEHYNYDGGPAVARIVGPGDSLNPTGAGNWAVWHSNVNVWGGGIAQGLDDAATILYLSYRHVSGSLTLRQLDDLAATGPIADAPIDDLDLLLTGAVITF